MGEVAELVAAIAALITAIGGLVGMVATAVRTGRRERVGAAETVVKAAVDESQDRRIDELEERIWRGHDDQ